MTANAMQYRPEVDGLRAVAVTLVLLFHLDFPFVSGGFVGVDVFFVISGFLITSKILLDLKKGHFSITDFYVARIRRIAPALLATIIGTSMIAAFIYSPAAFKELAESAFSAFFSISNIYFWQKSGYFDAAADTKALLHTWSLGVEEQFYLIWPILLIWLFRRNKVQPAVFLLLILVSAFVAEFILNKDSAAAYFLLPARFSELALGGLVALLSSRHSVRVREGGVLIGLSFILVPAFIYTPELRFPGITALIPCLGASAVIYFASGTNSSLLISNRLCISIGKISYSLYLVHWPIIVMAKYYLMRDLSVLDTCILIVAIFFLSVLSYRFIEMPFRRRDATGFKISTKPMVIAIVAPLIAACLPLGWAVIDGMNWRSPSAFRDPQYMVNPESFHLAYYGGRDCERARCETQQGSKRPIIYVLGDSHARALIDGLKTEFPDNNFVVYAPSACLFVSDTYVTARGSSSCPEARKAAFDEIRKHPAPVIVHQSWLGHVELKVFNSNDPSNVLDTLGPTKFVSFVADQIATLAKISNNPVTVMGAVPTSGIPVSPMDCVTRPYKINTNCNLGNRADRSIALKDEFNKKLQAALPPKTRFVDPFDYLCDEQYCVNFGADRRPLYSDGSHLSIWGSRRVISGMRKYGILAALQPDN